VGKNANHSDLSLTRHLMIGLNQCLSGLLNLGTAVLIATLFTFLIAALLVLGLLRLMANFILQNTISRWIIQKMKLLMTLPNTSSRMF
jgi:hypothetical protein